MIKHRNKLLSILIISFIFSSQLSASTISFQQKLSLLVQQASDQFDINTMSFAVLLPGEKQPRTAVIGSMSLKNLQPISATTLFKVGSITKTYTAVLIARAITEKRLGLSDRLEKYLPQYPKWKAITIADLVNQTSGIPDYIETPDWWENLVTDNKKIWKSRELVNLVYNQPMQFHPGKGWAYSNTNYILLGMILEKIFDKPASKLINQLISQVALQQTIYRTEGYNQNILLKLVHGYFQNKFDQTDINGSWLQTAGAMLSTPSDMTKWMKTLFINKQILGLPISHYFNFINTDNGKKASGETEKAYSFSIFRSNRSGDIIYFVPGLTSGYVSMMAYVPQYEVYFAYSVNKAPVPGLHDFMFSRVLKILSQHNIPNR